MSAICLVTTSYPKTPEDATAPFIGSIAEGLAARGLQVSVVLPAHPRLQAGVRAGVRLYPYRYLPFGEGGGWGYAESMEGDVRLRRGVYAAAPLAVVATFAATLRRVRLDSARLVHAHWVIPNGPPAALAAGLAGELPLVISLHGSDVHLAEKVGAIGRAARWAFDRAGAVTACSPDLAERAIRLGARADKVSVVPYGVAKDRFRPDAVARQAVRARLGLDAATVLVLGLGRLVYKKGFRHVIAAMAALRERNTVLALVGDGDLREELATQAAALGLGGRVRLPGGADRAEVAGWLAAADVLALPSVHDQAGNVDGLPNVLLEAMASGCAIVASDLAGVRLVMEPERDGLVVAEGDTAALVVALDRLASDAELRARLGQAARARAIQDLAWDRCVDGMLAAYARAGWRSS